MSKNEPITNPNLKPKWPWQHCETRIQLPSFPRDLGFTPTMIHNWKRALLDGAADILTKAKSPVRIMRPRSRNCTAHIGRLKVERDFLSKKLSL